MSNEQAPYKASFSVETLLEATGGRVLTHLTPMEPGQTFDVSTDTRTIGPGQWFLPISGANFDGHQFLGKALEQGANGAFVSLEQWEQRESEWKGIPNLIGVENTVQAYLDIAKWHRLHSNPKLKVIALTGSSGKTTTKEMLYAAFNRIQKTQKTLKNFNNEIGVSQTLLAIEPDTEIAIVEMGMRGLNQIDMLSLAACPNVALINNVGPAHIELLGSLENVAKAKLEIAQGLNPKKGILVTNGNDIQLNTWTSKYWKPENKAQWQTFQIADASAIRPTSEGGVSFVYDGQTVKLPVPGLHNVRNALGVLKVAEVLDLPLQMVIEGLARFQPEGGRWHQQAIAGHDKLWVINDAYNANPDSCQASLQTFFELPFDGLKRILVLGGMKELGPFSEQYHQQLADWLVKTQQDGKYPLDVLIGVGEEMLSVAQQFAQKTGCKTYHVDNGTYLIDVLKKEELPLSNALYFLKGSRFYQLEQLVQDLSPANAVAS